VRWGGDVPSLALAAERVREPTAAVRVLLAADTGAVSLTDSAGVLDTLRATSGGATLEASDVVGTVRARRGTYAASATPPAPADRRDVLVLGRASWESKFVLAALTEAVPLEGQAAGVATAVRRAGAGRVLSIGYDESWRWRMLGGTSGLPAHRAWWSRMVGLVAPEHGARAVGDVGDAAPAAALIDA